MTVVVQLKNEAKPDRFLFKKNEAKPDRFLFKKKKSPAMEL
jgi:hypothetical protein